MIFSVVKSRLQAGHAKYRSALDGIHSIIKNEGVEGIYKGVGNKLLQSVLTAALLFVGQKKIYEVIKKVSTRFYSVHPKDLPERWVDLVWVSGFNDGPSE